MANIFENSLPMPSALPEINDEEEWPQQRKFRKRFSRLYTQVFEQKRRKKERKTEREKKDFEDYLQFLTTGSTSPFAKSLHSGCTIWQI
jgi:biopolymer transport protein ExbB/TolQ